MTIRRSRAKKSKVKKPKTRQRARNIAQWIDQKITTYRGHIMTFTELNQSNDEKREQAIEDFLKAMVGDVETEQQGKYADVIDSIPILGDVAQLFVMARTEAEYQGLQIKDFLIGFIPILGDIADYLLTPDTNKRIVEMRMRQEYYNSLVALGKEKEAEAYRLEIEGAGLREIRQPKQKELDLLLGRITGENLFTPVDEWIDEKIESTAETWRRFGIFNWRELADRGERIGKNDRVQIVPEDVDKGLSTVQAGAKLVADDNARKQITDRVKAEGRNRVNKEGDKLRKQAEDEARGRANDFSNRAKNEGRNALQNFFTTNREKNDPQEIEPTA